jgi:uncharacterized protein Usg
MLPRFFVTGHHNFYHVPDLTVILQVFIHVPYHLQDVVDVPNTKSRDLLCIFFTIPSCQV